MSASKRVNLERTANKGGSEELHSKPLAATETRSCEDVLGELHFTLAGLVASPPSQPSPIEGEGVFAPHPNPLPRGEGTLIFPMSAFTRGGDLTRKN